MIDASKWWNVKSEPSLCCRPTRWIRDEIERRVAQRLHLPNQIGILRGEALDVGNVDARDDEEVDGSAGGAIGEADELLVLKDDVEAVRCHVAKDAFGRVDIVDGSIAC